MRPKLNDPAKRSIAGFKEDLDQNCLPSQLDVRMLAKLMVYYTVKFLTTALLVVLISEISKRSSLVGAILASLPVVSILAFIWLYIDTKSVEKVSELSTSIFWLVIPSLSLFIALPLLLKHRVNFYASLVISCAIMISLYFTMMLILKRLDIDF